MIKRRRSDIDWWDEDHPAEACGVVSQLTQHAPVKVKASLPIGFSCTPEQQKEWNAAYRKRFRVSSPRRVSSLRK